MKTFLAVIATIIICFVTVGLIYQVKEVKTKFDAKQAAPPPVDEKKILEQQVHSLASENEKIKDNLKKKDRDLKEASTRAEAVKKESQDVLAHKEKSLGELQKKVTKIENEKDNITSYTKALEDNVKSIKSENAEVKSSVKNLESRLMDIFKKVETPPAPPPTPVEEKKPAPPPALAEEKKPAQPPASAALAEEKIPVKPDFRLAEKLPIRKAEPEAKKPAQAEPKAAEPAVASKPPIPPAMIEEKPAAETPPAHSEQASAEAPGKQLALAQMYTYSLTREAPTLTVNQELHVSVTGFNYSNVDIDLSYGGGPPQSFKGKEAGDEISFKNFKIVVYQILLDGADLYIKRR